MLKTKSIFAPIEDSDGIRISIMSRHTLNDGKTPDSRITPADYEEHCTRLAPVPRLVGRLKRQEISFSFFEKKFNQYLETPIVAEEITRISRMAMDRNVTLMCAEATPEECHRRLVAEKCKAIFDSLPLLIN